MQYATAPVAVLQPKEKCHYCIKFATCCALPTALFRTAAVAYTSVNQTRLTTLLFIYYTNLLPLHHHCTQHTNCTHSRNGNRPLHSRTGRPFRTAHGAAYRMATEQHRVGYRADASQIAQIGAARRVIPRPPSAVMLISARRSRSALQPPALQAASVTLRRYRTAQSADCRRLVLRREITPPTRSACATHTVLRRSRSQCRKRCLMHT